MNLFAPDHYDVMLEVSACSASCHKINNCNRATTCLGEAASVPDCGHALISTESENKGIPNNRNVRFTVFFPYLGKQANNPSNKKLAEDRAVKKLWRGAFYLTVMKTFSCSSSCKKHSNAAKGIENCFGSDLTRWRQVTNTSTILFPFTQNLLGVIIRRFTNAVELRRRRRYHLFLLTRGLWRNLVIPVFLMRPQPLAGLLGLLLPRGGDSADVAFREDVAVGGAAARFLIGQSFRWLACVRYILLLIGWTLMPFSSLYLIFVQLVLRKQDQNNEMRSTNSLRYHSKHHSPLSLFSRTSPLSTFFSWSPASAVRCASWEHAPNGIATAAGTLPVYKHHVLWCKFSNI